MAIRLNTVEYAFPQVLETDASGFSRNFSQITIDIPEATNRRFISAYADIFILDAVTAATSPSAWGLGLRVGSSGSYLNQSVVQTIAQSVGACGHAPVRYWMHTNMLLLNGRKMSKSEGNSITPTELFTGQSPLISKAFSPMSIRFFMLQAHYRSTLDSETNHGKWGALYH